MSCLSSLDAYPRYSNSHRLGMIIPSLNVTIEPEFNFLAPREVSIHATRLFMRRGTTKDLESMADDTEKACKMLETARVGVILYACTTGSLIGGKKWQEGLEARMRSSVSIPVITTAGAVVDSLREMKLSKIAVATPYSRELNDAEQRFLEENGFAVTKIKGLGIVNGEELHAQPPGTTVRLAREVDNSEAEGIFLSCTDLKTFTVIGELEARLGKPVISSNSASLWKSLKLLMKNKAPKIKGFGALLAGTRETKPAL
jgi:maleate isomerase